MITRNITEGLENTAKEYFIDKKQLPSNRVSVSVFVSLQTVLLFYRNQLKLMRATSANINHCAVPFLSRQILLVML